MSEVCVSDAFTVVDGALGLAAWTGAVIALREQEQISYEWPDWSGITSLPGEPLWDHEIVAVNDAPSARLAVFRLQRPYSTMFEVPQPNAMQMRDGWAYRVGPGVTAPPVSVVEDYNGAWTASADSGTFSDGTTRKGRLIRYFPGSMVDVQVHVPAGETVALRWAGWVWTPPPWSNNADDGNGRGKYVIGYTLRTLMWLPVDEGTL